MPIYFNTNSLYAWMKFRHLRNLQKIFPHFQVFGNTNFMNEMNVFFRRKVFVAVMRRFTAPFCWWISKSVLNSDFILKNVVVKSTKYRIGTSMRTLLQDLMRSLVRHNFEIMYHLKFFRTLQKNTERQWLMLLNLVPSKYMDIYVSVVRMLIGRTPSVKLRLGRKGAKHRASDTRCAHCDDNTIRYGEWPRFGATRRDGAK